MPKHELLIIGSGPSGSAVAKKCAAAGMDVAVADKLFGGTCALYGCTPKKAMENVTSVYWKLRDLQHMGAPERHGFAQWDGLLRNHQQFTTLVTPNTKEMFAAKGITCYEGAAKFTGERTVQVGEDQEVTADNIIIATGAKPREMTVSGAELTITSDDFFSLQKVPRSIVFVGAGYISFELGHIAAACGSQVTIISKDEKPLPQFDPKMVTKLCESANRKGIRLITGYEATGVYGAAGKLRVIAEREKDGDVIETEGAVVLNATGREVVVDLDLEHAHVDYDAHKGIEVDAYYQTSNPHVYAIGDVTGREQFTPVAEREGAVVSHNLQHPDDRQTMDYIGLPKVMFTDPKFGMVGKLEQELQDDGVEFDVHEGDLSDDLLEKSAGNAFAHYRVFTEPEKGKILGAHLLGVHANEAVNLFALAMQTGLTARELERLNLGYPTAMHTNTKLFG